MFGLAWPTSSTLIFWYSLHFTLSSSLTSTPLRILTSNYGRYVKARKCTLITGNSNTIASLLCDCTFLFFLSLSIRNCVGVIAMSLVFCLFSLSTPTYVILEPTNISVLILIYVCKQMLRSKYQLGMFWASLSENLMKNMLFLLLFWPWTLRQMTVSFWFITF